jgi:hypothetical protein
VSADGIFISYRRSDSQHAAGRLADALVREFGDERIFRDIEDIEAGADFVDTLDRALSECRVMLVVIGGQWLELRDTQGKRRLDAAGDWVRQEIARALQRGIRVVPVLLEGTEIPPDDALPDDLRALTRRQAIRLSDAQWSRDVAALIAAVRPHLGVPGPAIAQAPAPAPTPAQAAPAISTRIEAGVRSGLTWAFRLLLGAGALVLVIVFFTVRACNSEPPDMTGRWTSAEGWTMEFQPQQRDGQKVYRVVGRAAGAPQLDCDAAPSFFGSIDLNCKLAGGTLPADEFSCSLTIGGNALTASGDCKWQRDGSTRKLSLER